MSYNRFYYERERECFWFLEDLKHEFEDYKDDGSIQAAYGGDFDYFLFSSELSGDIVPINYVVVLEDNARTGKHFRCGSFTTEEQATRFCEQWGWKYSTQSIQGTIYPIDLNEVTDETYLYWILCDQADADFYPAYYKEWKKTHTKRSVQQDV